jgi:transcriptional regulator with XRE-family HTH domain
MSADNAPVTAYEGAVGAVLAALRRDAGLSGTALGRRVGMSQAKISRIETGAGLPEPADVERIARALGAGDELIGRLVGQAIEQSQDRMTDWRLGPVALAGRQQDVEQLEHATTVYRIFQPAVIIGLLQTSEYARAVLTTVRDFMANNGVGSPAAAVPEAVSARVRRQEILADPGKRFHFVMAESVLMNRLCPPEEMPAQIQRIRAVARQENVSLAMIPADQRWSFLPLHGFELLDDRDVHVDLVNTGLTSHGRSDLRLYRQVFDTLERQATTDIDAMLDRYLELYLDLSRPGNRTPGDR